MGKYVISEEPLFYKRTPHPHNMGGPILRANPLSSQSSNSQKLSPSLSLTNREIQYQCGRSPNIGVNHDTSCVIYISCRFTVGFTLYQDLRFCASTHHISNDYDFTNLMFTALSLLFSLLLFSCSQIE